MYDERKISFWYIEVSAYYVYNRQITLKMADQGRSEIYVVFTKILCGRNFLFGKLQS